MENEETFQTTKEQFQIFKKECNYWIKRFGLQRYEWFFTWEDIEPRATVTFEIRGKIAYVTFSKQWECVKPTSKLVRQAAYHEVSEVFLGKLNLLARRREFIEDDIEAEVHSIIRVLESTQFNDDYARRFIRKKIED